MGKDGRTYMGGDQGVHVVGGRELLSSQVCDELRCSGAIRYLVDDMRSRESETQRRDMDTSPARLHRACLRSIAQIVPSTRLDALADELDAARFAQVVCELPRSLANAPQRRAAREIARTYALFSAGHITAPQRANDFHRMWELAMEGEPRWLDGFPTSEFRTQESMVVASPFTREIMQISTHPGRIIAELDELASFLADESIASEVRAVCGFLSFEFTHPFADGNGHVGRLLLLTTIHEQYSPMTLALFSRELVLGRGKASHEFALVRSGEHSVSAYCEAMLTQLRDCQVSARWRG